MYVQSLSARWFRCFQSLELTGLVYPGQPEVLRVPNVNVILGDNGSGKSAGMVAMALAVLGSMLGSAGYRSVNNVRRATHIPDDAVDIGEVEISITNHGVGSDDAEQLFTEIDRFGNAEVVSGSAEQEEASGVVRSERSKTIREILFDDQDPRLFLAAYGTVRQTGSSSSFDPSIRNQQYAERLQRVGSLLLPEFTLVPLASWLPKSEFAEEVLDLLRSVSERVELLPEVEKGGELVVQYRGTRLPWSALSDGYRSFFGWVGDLLWRLTQASAGKKLTDIAGTVLVDELDLHLHPRWQSEVVQALSCTFPKLQFIVTTHSPLIVGALDAENILILEQDEDGASTARRPTVSPWGLSAEQLLLSSDFGFDLDTARDKEFEKKLDTRRTRAAAGDVDAAIEFQRMLSLGNAGILIE